jgi:calpain-15
MDLHNRGAFFGASSDDDTTSTDNLVTSHAYSILKLIETDVNGRMVRFIQLRNPWGNKEWKGAYSDEDEARWTSELVVRLDAKFQDDGCFWMMFEDFYNQYERVNGVEIEQLTH